MKSLIGNIVWMAIVLLVIGFIIAASLLVIESSVFDGWTTFILSIGAADIVLLSYVLSIGVRETISSYKKYKHTRPVKILHCVNSKLRS